VNSPIGSFLQPTGFDGPRGVSSLARELSTVTEAARLLRRTRAERRLRAGLPYAGGHRVPPHDPVLLIPGFMAGDPTLRAMSSMLRQQGFRTYRAQIRVNVGCTREAAERLERRLEVIATRRNRKVSIVGHSLGGMLARGLAVRRPDLVAGIVTLGSPMLAPGAHHVSLTKSVEMLVRLSRAGWPGLMSEDCVAGECARQSFEESRRPLPDGVGFTAIYSKRDGIVDWRACVDPLAVAVEVTASHAGLAFDPRVIAEVLKALES
jgi:triacylglycerol lipase